MYGTNPSCQLLGSRFSFMHLKCKERGSQQDSSVVAAKRVATALKGEGHGGCCQGDESLSTLPPLLNSTQVAGISGSTL